MAIHMGTPVSSRRNLADVFDAVYRLEGECKDNDRAWVECRQLTEGEQGRVEAVKGAFQTRFDGDVQTMTRPIDWWAVRLAIVRSSLIGAGNIFGKDDKELFRFVKSGSGVGFRGGDAAFRETWEGLHPDVAEAIVRVALFVNPNLDVGDIIHEDPLVWLRENHAEVYEDMTKFQEESALKNVSRPGMDD